MPSLPFRSFCAKLRQAIKALSDEDRASLGEGLPRLIAAGTNSSLRMNAPDFLALCARLGIDPTTGERFPKFSPPNSFSFQLLGAGCAMRRVLRGDMSLRAVADETGISASTILRIELGLPVSIESVLAVCEFIGVHPYKYISNEKREAA